MAGVSARGLGKPLRCAKAILLHPGVGFPAAPYSSSRSVPLAHLYTNPAPCAPFQPDHQRFWPRLPPSRTVRQSLFPAINDLTMAQGGWGRIWVSKSKVKLRDKGSCGHLSK